MISKVSKIMPRQESLSTFTPVKPSGIASTLILSTNLPSSSSSKAHDHSSPCLCLSPSGFSSFHSDRTTPKGSSDFGGMVLDGEAAAPIGDLDDLLSKLSTWDGSDPTAAAAAATGETVAEENGKGSEVESETHLEMKELEPKDIDVILRLSAHADSSSGVRDGGVEAAERSKVESSSIARGASLLYDVVVHNSYVWYACYGSNMWKDRFMCYIQGGKVEGMTRTCVGCRDKSPPVASEWLSIPNRLFFARESTRTWGLGGVAFLNPISEPGVASHIRIYKITMEQFNDVLSQENPARPEKNWMTFKHIAELKKGEPHHLMDIFGEEAWYGTVKYLGEKDGLPILTFTCPESHMEKYRSGELGTFGPPDSYRNVIVKGLADLGYTEEQAYEYVSSAILPKDPKDHSQDSSQRLSATSEFY